MHCSNPIFMEYFAVDELEKGRDGDSDSHSLNTENLQRFNEAKVELPTKSSLLSDDKMKSIMAFLDAVQVTERLGSVDQVKHNSLVCLKASLAEAY